MKTNEQYTIATIEITFTNRLTALSNGERREYRNSIT